MIGTDLSNHQRELARHDAEFFRSLKRFPAVRVRQRIAALGEESARVGAGQSMPALSRK
jgi:hypothetical protein